MGTAHLENRQDLSLGAPSELDDLTPRQGEVLDAALGLLMRDGDKLTMIGVARAASCSKETLYKWFGDRAGLLTAAVQWQASKVTLPQISGRDLTRALLAERIEAFGANLLRVLSSDTSVALNRLAVTNAKSSEGAEADNLGAIVLNNGRREMGRRLKPVLEAGRDAGFLHFEDSEEAFRTFFGLVVRDVQIRRMLGDEFALSADELASDAKRAADQFFALYGANESDKTVRN